MSYKKYVKTLLGRANKLYNTKKFYCKKHNIDFDLDVEWYADRLVSGCELTGLPFVKTKNRCGPNMYSPTVDRIDPKVGYLKFNCRLILHAVNGLKSTGTDEDMYKIAYHLIKMKSQSQETNHDFKTRGAR